MEVIDSVVAVVATKDIDAASVDHSGVSISWTWWLGTAICIQLTPSIGRKVEAEEVIATIGSIVAAKDIEVVVKGDWGVEGAWARRVYLISLRRLNLVPCIGLLKHVRVCSTNDACAVEKRCVEALLARRIAAY